MALSQIHPCSTDSDGLTSINLTWCQLKRTPSGNRNFASDQSSTLQQKIDGPCNVPKRSPGQWWLHILGYTSLTRRESDYQCRLIHQARNYRRGSLGEGASLGKHRQTHNLVLVLSVFACYCKLHKEQNRQSAILGWLIVCSYYLEK